MHLGVNRRTVSQAVVPTIGIRRHGCREVLTSPSAAPEHSASWTPKFEQGFELGIRAECI
jgi:hypothetical protein